MEQHELEAAIAAGIFKGVLGVLALIFVLWLASPLLIPLAFAAQIYVMPLLVHTQIYAIEHWRGILALCAGMMAFWLVVYMMMFWLVESSVWQWFVESSVWQWFENRLSDGTRVVLLMSGLSSGGTFFVVSFASRGMERDFTMTDTFLLLGLFCFSVVAVYLALRRRGGNVKTP